MRMKCADCECTVERGVRLFACSDDCCCSDLPVAAHPEHFGADEPGQRDE